MQKHNSPNNMIGSCQIGLRIINPIIQKSIASPRIMKDSKSIAIANYLQLPKPAQSQLNLPQDLMI
ncbi:hypothetical protein H6G80_04385 [Nostoc sp. FACHB-87]|uniref:hypothetical protein n=1 Tax=Nostocaceae TaxID=1162 RepID=UPI001684EE37|nr:MULTISPECIES: hypothetical protein [Nostocaceae]MBD2453311.1 hypothetical protein [Nostoc sp. FACHB-87]MBD2474909.1 hypothetical protein [Anabaena sp. FACHB-83]